MSTAIHCSDSFRASSHEPGYWADSVTGTIFVGCLYQKQIRKTETKIVQYKLASLAPIVALLTPVILLIKLIRTLLKIRYTYKAKLCQFGCSVAKAKLYPQKKFSPDDRAGVFIWEKSVFIPVAEISDGKHEITPIEPAHRLTKDLVVCVETSETRPAWSTGLIWKGP